jgi:hypothetical protein
MNLNLRRVDWKYPGLVIKKLILLDEEDYSKTYKVDRCQGEILGEDVEVYLPFAYVDRSVIYKGKSGMVNLCKLHHMYAKGLGLLETGVIQVLRVRKEQIKISTIIVTCVDGNVTMLPPKLAYVSTHLYGFSEDGKLYDRSNGEAVASVIMMDCDGVCYCLEHDPMKDPIGSYSDGVWTTVQVDETKVYKEDKEEDIPF